MARGDLAALVRICDPAGSPRGTGFLADHHGTVVTSHEAVDGLARLIVSTADDRTCVVPAEAVTPLPERGLALLRTEGLGVRPLPLATRPETEPGTYVRIAAHGWREARVLGPASVTYTALDRCHVLPDALELAIGTEGAEALRLGGHAAGGPVLDATTGTVLAVVGTALHGARQAAGYAVPLGPVVWLPGAEPAALAAAPAVLATEPGAPATEPWVPAPEPAVLATEPGTPAAEPAVLGSEDGGTPVSGPDARDPRGEGPYGELLRRNAATVAAYGADLNLAAVLELTGTASGPARDPGPWGEPVERPACVRAFARFAAGDAPVLALVGAPGTGRTTALAALCARRAQGAEPAPTVRLRGADLRAEDPSVADAVGRALHQAGRIVAASGALGDTTTATPERAAALAREAGRPLLVVLDGPEEMPPALAHRLADWTATTETWLRRHGVRLVTACRPEHWEQAAAHYTAAPAVLTLGDLDAGEARAVRRAYGIGEDDLAPADARHPLALRLLAEVRAALPGQVPGRPGREEIFTAYLDLMCLRIAVRIAAGSRPLPRGTAVRRLAARVTGQVHEAARRCLGPGHGVLDRASFEELFPWREGWASAVLTEGLLVPAGSGYRFAHEELADWVQAAHLDLDGALHALVHRWHEETPAGLPSRPAVPRQRTAAPEPPAEHLPVPRHRIGPVLQALLLLHRDRGPAALAPRLAALVDSLDRFADEDRAARPAADGPWWGARLLAGALGRVGDPRPYLPVLRLLADRIGARSEPHPVFAAFGTAFWAELPLGEDERIDLLRRLVPGDPPPGHAGGDRHLDVVAGLLTADPRGVQPLLCRWFGDDRPLPAAPHATVATAAQALLHTHRALAVDDLCEALVATAHPLADGLLAALAEDEPSALCRAVDRWAHDDGRPDRRVAAAAYGLRVAAHATTPTDRELLRYAALALLARPADQALHGPALGLLVRDPQTRARHLPRALAEPRVPAAALAEALTTHPELVLVAFRERLQGTGEAAAAALRALATVDTPALTRRIAALVRDYIARHPEGAPLVAAFVDRRFEDGPAARAVLFPLVTGLIKGRPAPVRAALAPVLAAPGTGASRHLRAELLDVLLEHERYGTESGEPSVLDALLTAAARDADRRSAPRTRDLVHRASTLYTRTPEGPGRRDRLLAALAREHPAFAALFPEPAPPPPRSPGTSMPMRSDGLGHGSLRPA